MNHSCHALPTALFIIGKHGSFRIYFIYIYIPRHWNMIKSKQLI